MVFYIKATGDSDGQDKVKKQQIKYGKWRCHTHTHVFAITFFFLFLFYLCIVEFCKEIIHLEKKIQNINLVSKLCQN